MASDTNIIWIDLEMTGLNPEKDTILEIAGIVTNSELEELDCHKGFALQHTEAQLKAMDEWNTTHHSSSGLWDSALKSDIQTDAAAQIFIDFISPHVTKGKAILAGNSIWQDRRFLTRHMPTLEEWFHYRMIDVSTLKCLHQMWKPNAKNFEKKNQHRALDDIRESVAELRWYREQGL